LFTSRLCPLLACFSLKVSVISSAQQIRAIPSTVRCSGRSRARLSFWTPTRSLSPSLDQAPKRPFWFRYYKKADTAFNGEGAKEYGGRFNRVGTPVVYTSESLALATLELLTKINSRRRATGRVCLPVRFDDAQVLVRTEDDLPEGWDARPYGPASQEIGDAWVRSQASLVLRVLSIVMPRIVVPREHNYLINPRHPDASSLEIGPPEPLDLDPRILSD